MIHMGKKRIRSSLVALSALLIPAMLVMQPSAQAKSTPNTTTARAKKATTTTVADIPSVGVVTPSTETPATSATTSRARARAVTTTAPATTTTTTAPVYTFHRGDFGITPGSGTFLQTDTLPQKFDGFKALGVRFIRSTITWNNIQPTDPGSGKPVYNWKGVDAFTSILNSPKYFGQFRIIVTFENPPSWAAHPKKGIAHVACAEQPPFDLQQYASAAAALAGHLQNQNIRVFELENSPNITPGVWAHANPCAYTQLLKKSYPAIHAAYPDARVLVGGIGGVKTYAAADDPSKFAHIAADEFLQALYDNGAKGCFDGVSFHAYSSPFLPCDPKELRCPYHPPVDPKTDFKDPYGPRNGWNRMVHAHLIMTQYGDGAKRIWITEFGAATDNKPPGGGGGIPVTEQYQSIMMVAAFQRASQEPWIGPLCIYTYQDGNRENHGGYWMGLLRLNGSPKPAYTAYKSLTALVAPAAADITAPDDAEL